MSMVSLKDIKIISEQLISFWKRRNILKWMMTPSCQLPTNCLECTWELHPVIDLSYDKGPCGHFFMSNLNTHQSQFCVSAYGHFKNICIDHIGVHDYKTKQLMKNL
jgi:hypothetical protein